MGLAIARRFGAEGFHVVLMARRQESLDCLVSTLHSEEISASSLLVDVSDAASISTAFSSLQDTIGIPDVLVYNAATAPPGVPSALEASSLNGSFSVNVTGALLCAQQVLPAMRARNSGTILFTGGGLALSPYPQMTALSIGKAALRSLALCLAGELTDTQVVARTVTICGFVKPGTHFDPDKIAETFWKAHSQPDGEPELRYE